MSYDNGGEMGEGRERKKMHGLCCYPIFYPYF